MCVYVCVYKKIKEMNNENYDFGDYLDYNMIKKKKKIWYKIKIFLKFSSFFKVIW